MAQRTICVQSPAKMHVKNSALVLSSSHSEMTVPLDDIWVIVVENRQVVITASLLAAFAEAGIGVIVCGADHMPCALQLPLGAHSRHSAIVEQQLLISKPLKKQLWQRIVKAKINNQARCLEYLGLPGADVLYGYAKVVASDDSTGREAVAAAYYFRRLLSEGTRREGPYAAPLDYGYAIIRAGIGREAVSKGWLVSRGLHHCNELNSFNLVDDLIEPFRPVVDLLVCEDQLFVTFNKESRARLSSVFEYCVLVNGKRHSVQSAIAELLASLKRAVLEKNAELISLPELLPLQRIEVDKR